MEIWSIINVTPDSFWHGSRAGDERQVIDAAQSAISQGADVLDIGALSTRPNYTDVSPQEEFARLDRAIGAIRGRWADFPLSIDTFRSSIVRQVYNKYGRFTVNDIQGGVQDKEMYSTVASLGLDYVLMSMDADVASMELFFERQIALARRAGIEGRIVIDPGFGFGKTVQQNFDVLRQMGQLQHFGCDILAGISRKSMIWRTLGSTPNDALAGTCALHWQALLSGATILRAHDTGQASDVARLYSQYVGT